MNKDISSSVENTGKLVEQLADIRETHSSALEALKKAKFTGVSKYEDQEACSVEMDSQYTISEVFFDPYFLEELLKKEMIDTSAVDIDQLVQVCISLGEVAKAAFNEVREKTHTSSQKVFNNFMESMEDLFKAKDEG